MLKGIKIRKDDPEQVEEPTIQKKHKPNDEIKLSQIHRQRLREKGKQFDDISDDEEQDPTKPKTKQQKQKENQQKGEVMYQQKLSTKALQNCNFCLANEKLSENIILSNGNHSMILLPQQKIYQEYWHLYIVPIEHVNCIRDVEDNTYEEIRNYMKCLVAAFDQIEMELIFFENAYKFKTLPHAIMECVAIPYKISKEVKLNVFFKQGMDDLDGLWATHKKIIDITKAKGGIRKQIPKGFPYFYVDFSLQFGYAHVIENEAYFTLTFVREIIASILKIEKNYVISPPNRDEKEFSNIKDEFTQIWKKYDWTVMLRQ